MTVQEQINNYIADQVPAKREELQSLHRMTLGISPNAKLWFLDGRNDEGKVVTNPNIGYGAQAIRYANGETREFYQVGLSANTTGISVYVMGLEDKKYLSETYGAKLGKAKVTGYCIKFRSLSDINVDVLQELIASHLAPQGGLRRSLDTDAGLPHADATGREAMEIRDWSACPDLVDVYRDIRELGLERNLAELEAVGYRVVEGSGRMKSWQS